MAGDPVCIDDFEKHAQEFLPKTVWNYYYSGANAQQSREDCENAFKRLRLRPRILRDVSIINTSTTVLGDKIDYPVCVAPTAGQKLAHPDGEVATAKASCRAGTCMVHSTWSTSTIEEVARSAPQGLKWYHMYLLSNEQNNISRIHRAEKEGYKAIVLTVDSPYRGRKYPNERYPLSIPPHLNIPNVDPAILEIWRSDTATREEREATITNPRITWDAIRWLRSVSKLPVVLKGILTGEDARLAVQHGVDGIIVSCHGGRELDTVPASIEVLPEIVEAVDNKCEVYLDGGIRYGTDVFKALALGARAVFVGRPVLWGLAYQRPIFNAMIMGVIMLNALVIGLETMDSLKNSHGQLFQIVDELFLSIYTVEFFLKLYAEPKGYWKSSYNRFDFLILFISYIQAILDMINVGDNVLKPLRLLRAARTLRTISFIEGLQVLVIALIETLRHSVLNVVVLLSMSMGFFAVVGYYMFGHDEETGIENENWSSLSAAMLTLFTYVTVDGWTDIQAQLETRPYSQWFTISFIFLGHFIFTNLFIGIIIMNIHEATETFRLQQVMEKEATLQLKKDFLYQRQHNDVKEMLEKQKSSQFVDFKDMCRAFEETLRHEDHVIMTDTSTNLVWMETFITTLDHLDLYTHRCQQLHFQLSNCLVNMREMQKSKEQEAQPSRT